MTIRITLLFLFFIQYSFGQDRYVDFKESFTNNSKNWNLNSKSKIEKGYLVLQQSIGPFQRIDINPKYDYTIETILNQKTGDKNIKYGIVWGYTDNKNYHVFEISSDGSVRLYSNRNGRKNQIRNKVYDVTIEKNRNSLKIHKSNGNINFYINNQLFHSTDKIYNHIGEIGFKSSSKIRLYVDKLNVRYYHEPMEINLIKKPVNGYKLENLGNNINTSYSELHPYITTDGNTLYFVRGDNPENTNPEKQDIWASNLDHNTNTWSKAKNIGPPLNNDSHNGVISISASGNQAAVRHKYNGNGSSSGGGISISYNYNKKWTLPVPQSILNYKNESANSEFCLSSTGMQLIMTIDDGYSYGDRDLYISFKKKNKTWTKPLNMGSKLNTIDTEISPFLATDNKTLFFASKGHVGYGSSDIFMSKRLDDSWTNWSEPQNLGPEINGNGWDAYFTLSALGDYAYMVRNGDIYKIKLTESVKPEPTITINGFVIDTETNDTINAVVKNIKLNTDKTIAISHATKANPYKFILPLASKCKLDIEMDGFFLPSKIVDLSALTAFKDTTINLYATASAVIDSFTNIYFDVSKYKLREEEKENIISLIEILNNYQDYNFEIIGHTDDDPIHKGNQYLSEKRAKTVFDFLISNGISESKLIYKGLGENMPVYPNINKFGKQLNRRVEIKFLEQN